MDDLGLISEAKIEFTSSGATETGAAVQQLGAGVEGLVVSQDKLSAAQIRVNRALETTARKVDAEYRSISELAKIQQVLDRARSQGLSNTAAYAAASDGLTTRLSRQAEAMQAASQAAQKLAMDQAAAAQQAGQKLGELSYTQGSSVSDQDIVKQRAALLPLVAAQLQYNEAVANFDTKAKQNIITEKERTTLVNSARATLLNQTSEVRKAEEANGRLTKGVGLNAYAWQNLSFQVNDVVTSLASGISPFQTLAQQGGQIYQILQQGQGGVGGALKAIGERLLSINPLVGVFGAMAAAAAGVSIALYSAANASRDVQLGLLGVGAGAGLTADQIGIIAIQASKTANITVGAAREIELAFLKSGKVASEAFLPGTVAVANYARKNSVSNNDAASMVAQNLTELGEGGYEKLAKEAGNFDVVLEAQMRALLNAGNAAEAQRIVIERFAEAYSKAGDKLNIFERAMNVVKSGASNLSDSIARGVSGVVEVPEQLNRIEAQISNRKKLSVVTGVNVDTSDLDAQRDKIKADLAKLGEDAAAAAKKVKANLDGLKRDAVNSVVPQLADLKKVRSQIEENNALLTTIETGPKPANPEVGRRLEEDRLAAVKTGKALAAVERDYAAAGGPANLEREKGNRLLKAKFALEAARTPEQKQSASMAQADAENFGTKTDPDERRARVIDAAKKALNEYQVESRKASDATNENTKTQNQLADATAKGANKSVEAITARRKVEEDVAAGRTALSEKDKKIEEQLQSQLGVLNKAAADRVKNAQIEAQARESGNASIEKGGRSAADAARRIAGETEVRKLKIEAMATEGEAAQNLTQRSEELAAAQARQLSADDKAKLLGLAEDEQRKIDLLMEESRLLGENTSVRQTRLAVMQAEQALKKDGIDPTSDSVKPYLDKVRMRADLDAAKTEYERLASDISSAVSGIFDDMFKKGNKGFAGFADSFSKGFSRIGTRLLEQNIIAPLIGGQGLDGKGGGLEKLFSGFGKIFDTDKVEKAVASGSESGTSSGFLSIFKPKSGGASNGAFSMSGLGGGVLAAGAGASIGYQSQSPLMGVLGGALTGAATPLGPLGAVIGAGAGLLGGLFGESQAKKEAKKKLQQELAARKEALEQAKPQIEQLSAVLSGSSVGNVGKNISDALSQVKAAAKTASDGGDRALADKLVRDFETYVARQVATFARGFEGVLAEVENGFGTSGPFSTALGAVQTLGDALKGFVADAGRLTDPSAQQRARAAAVEGALSSVEAPKTLSSTQTELQRINGTAAGLTQVLKDLGLTAEQAATAINDRTNKALSALADKFNTDLDRKLNDAKGKDYLNDAADLMKEVAGLNADAASLGQDGSKVGDYFSAAAQKIVDNSQLVGDAFNELISAFPDLAGKVHEYTADSKKSADEIAKAAADALSQIQDRKRAYEDRAFAVNFSDNSLATKLTAFDRSAEWEQWQEMAKGGQALDELIATQVIERNKLIADYNAAVKERKLNFQDRTFAATNDTSTLSGQLAAYDRQAQREREDEVKAGGEALAQLEQAQYSERLKIITDFQKQATEVAKQQLAAAQSAFETFVKNIKTYLDNLRAGPSSPLSPKDRLAAAQSQYDAQLAAAKSGDRTALDNITQYSDTLLEASKAYNASGEAYQATFQKIVADLQALPTQVSAEQFIVDAIKSSGDAIVSATDAMRAALLAGIQANSPALVATALMQNFQMLDTSVNGLLDYGEFTAGLGPLATADEQRQAKAIFNAIDTNGDGQLSKLEIANAANAQIANFTNATADQVYNGNLISSGQRAVMDEQSRILGAINNLTAVQNDLQVQLINLNQIIGGQNEYIRANTAYTNEALQRSAQAQGDTYLLQGQILNNLRSANAKNGAPVYATGGWVNGPGTGTSDSISARLSNGEFVVNAASARLNGPLLEALNDNAGFQIPAVAMPVPVPVPVPVSAGGGQSNAELIAEVRALRAELAGVKAAVKENTVVAENGHIGTMREVRGNTAAVQDGNGAAARQALAKKVA